MAQDSEVVGRRRIEPGTIGIRRVLSPVKPDRGIPGTGRAEIRRVPDLMLMNRTSRDHVRELEREKGPIAAVASTEFDAGTGQAGTGQAGTGATWLRLVFPA
jgi:hypothetical protein